MDLRDSIMTACQMISRNKVQSFLTMLGIVIGVMAVIIIMSLGASAQEFILGQVKTYGSNMVAVLPGKSDDSGPPAAAFGLVITSMKNKDGEDIRKMKNPHIEELSMYVRGNDIISWENSLKSVTFYGTSSTYPKIENAELKVGRFFDEEEENAKVIVLGSKVADELFGSQDPLGKRVRIKKTNFTVIGVFTSKGGNFIQNQDEQVFVPLKTAQSNLLGIDHLDFIRVRIDNVENYDLVEQEIASLLRSNHDIDSEDDDDFSIRSVAQAVEVISSITDILKFFLVAVSAISLLVGGFGIMNIMLAIVQERIKEIGLRKALGANEKDIVWQFLVETTTITFISGVIGIVLGIGIAYIAAQVINLLGYEWTFLISYDGILLGCFVSVFIGLIFGIVPALKASKLDPIDALAYE
ncbi:MAG: hypothetical protein MNSN_03300 [Minisyncoccus archaeiphilus]|uniref:ABC transporter permease n=1 Tax=Minisyncoccus archaeiphilus TaxID=3238481 RepID=UPI002B1A73B0|nr:MAG: hypothetical protein MNSN_03300 [Candidatus Parcubacteria bacterium]